ncbi:KptA family-domain-containing protein [Mycena polygramma]|nr:KptA family-domain-containing protein [Mycena polygramma]
MLSRFQPPPRCRNFLPFLFREYSGPPPTRPWPGKRGAERGLEMTWVSRELAFLLRHGAKAAGLPIRSDGYVKVEALLGHRSLRGIDFTKLEAIVQNDQKSRYHLLNEARPGESDLWCIRANQGHSMPEISIDLKPITSANEIPMAVHGTSVNAWKVISKQGLSRMTRNHIHLAQGVVGDVISGMRKSSQVLVFIDVARALNADIKFCISSNGVVLTPGNDQGFLEPRFFSQVQSVGGRKLIPAWEKEG